MPKIIPAAKFFYTALSCLIFTQSLSSADIEPLAPGVTYEFRAQEGPLALHILRVDPTKVRIVSAHALNDGLGREPLSEIANRTGAIAAINGGFFKYHGSYDGQNTSMLKIDGHWLSTGKRQRAAIGWKKDLSSVLFDRLKVTTSLKIQGTDYPIDHLNSERHHNETVLYNWAFHRSTLTSPRGTEVIIQDGKVTAVRKSKGDSSIPVHGFVYSIGNNAKVNSNSIQPQSPAAITFTAEPLLSKTAKDIACWQECDYVVGATPLLIKDGKDITDFDAEQVRQSFLKSSHPRTAIGTCEDGTWVFVVVDGRNPLLSRGMTMVELRSLMRALGCINAINLDGGGSSTMTISSQVVNFPCNTNEEEELNERSQRPISDAIIILPKEDNEG